MIRSFRNKETAAIWQGTATRRLPRDIQERALRKMQMLNAADTLSDLAIPAGNRLEALYGDRRGHWSIRVNDRWRVCFRWDGCDAWDVELVDYH